ncbi:MAG: hypothetical protein DRJ68_06655 [Thermoprotei archaeon]|nr:MAG: hypothetical protein DRJ68_06655 [Thermoprotei archaeon]
MKAQPCLLSTDEIKRKLIDTYNSGKLSILSIFSRLPRNLLEESLREIENAPQELYLHNNSKRGILEAQGFSRSSRSQR